MIYIHTHTSRSHTPYPQYTKQGLGYNAYLDGKGFFKDAIRTHWRLALDALWFDVRGHACSLLACSSLSDLALRWEGESFGRIYTNTTAGRQFVSSVHDPYACTSSPHTNQKNTKHHHPHI